MSNDKKFTLLIISAVFIGFVFYSLLLAKPFSSLDDCLNSDMERGEELKQVAVLIDQGDETQDYYCELSHQGYLRLEQCLDTVKTANKIAYSIYIQLPRFTEYINIVDLHNSVCANEKIDLVS